MKPILFSTPMVKAIMEDRKTKTRRVINPQPVINLDDKRKVTIPVNRMHGLIDTLGFFSVEDYIKNKARYEVGNILWVRETWRPAEVKCNGGADYFYYADGFSDASSKSETGRAKWKPSIHMPRKAARIFLRVTDVKIERLQDITEEDAEAEGVKAYGQNNCSGTSARIAFAELWDGLNEKRGYGWRKNPWVWVYTFERCEKPSLV
jgi:hypothetical protein